MNSSQVSIDNNHSKYLKYFMVGCIICASCNNILFKRQDEYIENPVTNQKWNHQFIQVFLVFFAESLCFLIWKLLTFYRKFDLDEIKRIHADAQLHPQISGFPPHFGLILAIFEIVSSSLEFTSLILLDQSVFMMLKGGIPLITALFSVIMFNRRIRTYESVGMVFVMVGLMIVGYSQYSRVDDTNNNEYGLINTLVGLIFILISLCITSAQTTLEEKSLKFYSIEPLKLIGLEGIWGLLLWIFLITIVSNIPCTYEINNEFCNENGYLEDIPGGLKSAFQDFQMTLFLLFSIVSLALNGFFSCSVTRYASAITTSILSTSVIGIVWLFDLYMKYEEFSWFQAFGFVILVIGNLIYQQIIRIGKENIEENPLRANEELEITDSSFNNKQQHD